MKINKIIELIQGRMSSEGFLPSYLYADLDGSLIRDKAENLIDYRKISEKEILVWNVETDQEAILYSEEIGNTFQLIEVLNRELSLNIKAFDTLEIKVEETKAYYEGLLKKNFLTEEEKLFIEVYNEEMNM